MGRQAKGPRLWMQPARYDQTGRVLEKAVWCIRDGAIKRSTGRFADERNLAEDDLRNYVNGHHAGRPVLLTDETRVLLARTKIGNIYFISCDRPLFPIKIGFAIDIRVRMRALQGAMPWPLMLLGSMEGDTDKERELHQQFGRLRMQGEWFARGHELLEYINQVIAASAPKARHPRRLT